MMLSDLIDDRRFCAIWCFVGLLHYILLLICPWVWVMHLLLGM